MNGSSSSSSSSPPFLTTQRQVDAFPFLFLLFLAVVDFAWLASFILFSPFLLLLFLAVIFLPTQKLTF
jgi:hypothetical protein